MPRTVSDEVLRRAGRILLVDPQRPGWYRPLHVRLEMRGRLTVEIPVDSTDVAAIQDWRDRIRDMQLSD